MLMIDNEAVATYLLNISKTLLTDAKMSKIVEGAFISNGKPFGQNTVGKVSDAEFFLANKLVDVASKIKETGSIV